MAGLDLLVANLLSPVVLSFVLGVAAGLLRSELELPDAVLKLLSIYLLLSIGLAGGRELAQVQFAEAAPVLGVALLLTVLLPVLSFLAMRRGLGLSVPDAAAVAAHYGSVSTVTFFAAIAFARAAGTPPEGMLAAVVAIMEFAVVLSLALARFARGGGAGPGALLLDTLRGRGILLLGGGMLIGAVAAEAEWRRIAPFYEGLFRGFLMIFLLEMGMTAARQFRRFAEAGWRLAAWAVLAPLVFGAIGVVAGGWAGLSPGGAFVLGAVCASASYIDAPAACRAALPEANVGVVLTASLGITFPFNLLLNLPLLHALSLRLHG